MRQDHDAMIEALEEGLSKLSGNPVRVRSIRAEPHRKSASFAMHRLAVQLESGHVLAAVFKDLNPLRQLPNARRVRRLELSRSRREIWMYRDVLPGLALGTPRLYGYRWEPERGNLWLFVEDVGPHRLAHRGDLALFELAAAWVGRFHAATTGAPSDERLLRYDRAHFQSRGTDLEAWVQRIAASDRPLVERALARHAALVQLVDGLPHGMIHGEFFGKNVLLRGDRSGEEIAVIDWETAAIGPRYVDLASISAGRWTPRQRMAMRRAYFDARYTPLSRRPDWARFNQEVDLVAFLQAVSWLGFWVGSDPGDPRYASQVARWLHELRTTMAVDTLA
jgi:hypothetical protein